MKLDLRRGSILEREHIDLLNDIAVSARKPFCDMIDRQAEGRQHDINWWVSEVASRNTMTNDLFRDCCFALLAVRLLDEQNGLTEVFVDKPPMKEVLDRYIRDKSHKCTVRCETSGCKRRFYQLLHSLRGLARSTVIALWRSHQACKIPTRLDFNKLHGCTLVDVFVFEHSFKDGRYQDRYFNDFGGELDSDIANALVYLATPQVSLKSTASIFAQLRAAKQPMILAEDFLRPIDYLYALSYCFRAAKTRPHRATMMNLDVTAILNDVWLGHIGSFSSINGLLRYRFVRRLKEREIWPRLVVDWFENQILDKAGNFGFRNFFPETPLIGYQGNIIHPFYLCNFPTMVEFECGVLPQKIGVSGKQTAIDRKEFCQPLDTMAAPAFRYTGLWKPRKSHPEDCFFTVLVPLSITVNESIEVLQAVVETARLGLPDHVRFWVKPHPGAGNFQRMLEEAGITLPENFSVIGGDLLEAAEQSNLMIGNASGTCLEVVARGIPVIIVGSRFGFLSNPIPDRVDPAIWKICYEPKEIAAAIVDWTSRENPKDNKYESIAMDVRNKYFEETVRFSVYEPFAV